MASFQKEYGLRLSQELENMKWQEFSVYLNGLGPETPLGRIVAIRSEDDAERIKQMSPAEKKVRNEWRRRQAAKRTPAELDAMYTELQTAVKGMIK